MAENGRKNLKIKTVSGTQYEEDLTFSPEEMQPIEVAEALETDLIMGKTPKQIKKARRLFGANEIRREFRLSFRESLRNQFKGLMGGFLIVSSLIMFLFRPTEATYLVMALAVAAITVLNALAEYRASIALRLPKKYSSLKARVMRNGEESMLDSRVLVPGDVISVDEGMMVPADCRIIDDINLCVMETHVSGSAGSVRKDGRYIARNGIESICPNMLYAGSIVTSGHASAIVCRTGKDTLQRRMRENLDDYTPPIMKYVQSLCRFMSVASLTSCLLLLVIGVLAGADVTDWFIVSVAIGASSLCDSMVSLCASSLGFGCKKMAEDGTVVKNYGCIQTLAAANTIMCGKNLAFPPKRIALTGLFLSGKSYDREKRPDESAEELVKLLLVCSDARMITAAEKKKTRGLPEYEGSPIENAVVDYFGEWNKPIGPIREQYIRMDAEYSLSGDVSRMLVLRNGKNTVIVRGSPENIFSRCVGYTLDGTDYKLSDFTRKKILSAAEDAARTASFLVAVACGETDAETLRDIEAEHRLIFKGFVSFASSLDPGVAEAVYRCDNAGIETVLNSNDAYYTALNSAKSAGIINDESQIITAEQLRSCSRGLVIANVPFYRLFLNVDDNEWNDIISLRKDSGRVTVVTAERINELPNVATADVSMVPESSCDTLRMTADAMMLGSGINLISDAILNAKTICRRISSVLSYLPVGIIMMLVASLFTAFHTQSVAFRAQDVLFGGMLFNLAFAFALAFEPRSVKNLRDAYPFSSKNPHINDFIYPLMFAMGGGFVLYFISSATQSYTCSMISLTLMLFLYAGSVAAHGGVFAARRFGNRLLYLSGALALLMIFALTCTGFGHRVFGYGVPEPSKLTLSLVLCLAYFTATQVARYFISPKGKQEKSADEDAEPEADPERTDGADDSDETDTPAPAVRRTEEFHDFFGNENDENEKENNPNERSDGNDQDNG
ncbi:MAG: cation-transporting P-type ATPase [Clostridia bacterium]|nr:cation-transporting P-type ATPase [Clostridia bacterium]